MIVKRIGKFGQAYELETVCGPDNHNKCRITCNGQTITVDHSLETISQAWYNWQQAGMHIQAAFSMLSAPEREFILTGITPEKWAKIFPVGEDDDAQGFD